MARGQTLLSNFTAGELSPLLDVRSDLAKYKNGASLVRNGIVIPHGGVRKRPGTMHVFQVKDETRPNPRLEPFQFNTEQAYIHEIGHEYIRFYKDRGIITDNALTITGITAANPGVVSYTGTDPTNGQQGVITGVTGSLGPYLNGRRFTVANVNGGANTFELSGFSTASLPAWSAGGTFSVVVELATTYDEDEIDDLSFAQSADTQYIAHGDHPLRKLTRASHVSWSLAAADIQNGPFRTINGNKTHYLSVAVAGSASISAATKANPVVITTSAPHDFEEGAHVTISGVSGMTEVNSGEYIARNVTSTTFELWTLAETPVDGTGFTTYTSGGTATISVTDFGTISPGSKVTLASTDDLFDAGHVGALFRLWEPGKSTGVATPAESATIANDDSYTYDGKVYGIQNLTGGAAWNGNWTFPTHEAGVVRIQNIAVTIYHDSVYLHDSSCVLKITAVANAKSATARVVRNHIPKSVIDNKTSLWEEGAWSAYRGYPRLIVFHGQRLWAVSTRTDPQFVWASRLNSFEDFQDGPDDDDAIIAQFASDRVEVARWIASGRALLMGTANGEFLIHSGSQNSALSPTSINIAPQTPYGSSAMRPLRVSEAVLFGQRNGLPSNPSRRVRETSYDFNKDGYTAPDVGIISNHITGEGVTEGAFQAAPDPVAWFVREDGALPALTYEPEQTVKAWHLHTLGGTDVAVKRNAVIPGVSGDELWLLVERTINGSSVHYIEYLTEGVSSEETDLAVAKKNAVYLDSALTYSGSATTSITGLWHLEGQSVEALADGSKVSARTVANGAITLDIAASLVHVGLKPLMRFMTVDLDALAQAGTALGRPRRVHQVNISVFRSLGGRIGPSPDKMKDIIYRSDSDQFGSSPALRTMLLPIEFEGEWDKEAVIYIEHDEPYPFTILGIIAEMTTVG